MNLFNDQEVRKEYDRLNSLLNQITETGVDNERFEGDNEEYTFQTNSITDKAGNVIANTMFVESDNININVMIPNKDYPAKNDVPSLISLQVKDKEGKIEKATISQNKGIDGREELLYTYEGNVKETSFCTNVLFSQGEVPKYIDSYYVGESEVDLEEYLAYSAGSQINVSRIIDSNMRGLKNTFIKQKLCENAQKYDTKDIFGYVYNSLEQDLKWTVLEYIDCLNMDFDDENEKYKELFLQMLGAFKEGVPTKLSDKISERHMNFHKSMSELDAEIQKEISCEEEMHNE